MNTKIRLIITGTTGMVGEGVLHESINNSDVEAILIINRKKSGVTHSKVTEIIHSNFYDMSNIENSLKGYNTCFFCLGVSSIGMSEKEYTKVTYTLTMHVAQTLSRLNQEMKFCYISGAGTNSTEKGRSMWARVKGKTENDLMMLPFSDVYAFRPGFIKPIKGLTKVHNFYKYINWIFPFGRAIYPAGFCRMTELGAAMMYVANHSYGKKVIDGKDIISIAARQV
ncbi:NAD-dependent epimerase/dehydratase family protein [Mucilaginibacter segetis]|uniref:NAD-dependent epimerase/dehydratase family protein n=1 Tax=Mucilaginibacter segetis TaxID=2793071 RepID=A0A934UMU8_9SPHI|nr:NAD-dependent epimerase/dehydratase family protein [Mucilaginibacter segetis]MBK0379390.1 NAD-dependent epimerase/dehydratase family protein [Mucilaginibacter segetis]